MDKDKAYLENWLWIPRSSCPVSLLKTLEIEVNQNGKIKTIYLWDNSLPTHIGIPRKIINSNKLGFKINNIIPKEYESIEFKSNIILDSIDPKSTTQRDALNALLKSDGGILNLSCGKGKTIILLELLSRLKIPAIIINDKEHILNQWKDEINKHLEFKGQIGKVQGNPKTWTWKNPIVLCSLKSLAMYRNFVSKEMAKYFGVIIYDEIHHLGAEFYSLTAHLFYGKRFGATATIHRPDGLEIIYRAHIGESIYTDLTQDIKPKVVFITSPITADLKTDECRDVSGRLHIRKCAAYIGKFNQELTLIKKVISDVISKKRKTLVLSSSLEQLAKLKELFPDSGIIVGKTKVCERLQQLNNSVIFATSELAKEALNCPELDSLLLTTEATSEILLQQSVGRIQRFCLGKKEARVVVIWHVNIPPLLKMGKKMMRFYKNIGFDVSVR
jgi:superfamily II DNA or RNA helicase